MERTHMGTKEMSSRKKLPCTKPNLLHYHCLVQGTEGPLRGQGEKGREGDFPKSLFK